MYCVLYFLFVLGTSGSEIIRAKDQKLMYTQSLDQDTINVTLDFCEKNNYTVGLLIIDFFIFEHILIFLII